MDTVIFDGRAFATNEEKELKNKVDGLKKKKIIPRMVTLLIGDDPASKLFVDKKKKAGDRLGVKLDVIRLKASSSADEIINKINEFNKDGSIYGIMVQLPLPNDFSKKDREEIINSITRNKDVDGMRDDSPYLAPVVKAVIYALKEASNMPPLPLKVRPYNVVVVGYTGFEGKKIYRTLEEMGYEVFGADLKTKNLKEKTKNADVLISVTGVPGLIKESMVKEGCVLIDVGAPDGDIEKESYKKASFVSPVPGGIGPVTIVSLLENLVEACA